MTATLKLRAERVRELPLCYARAVEVVMAGYSSTPLFKKLGFKAPLTVYGVALPAEYSDWLGEMDAGVQFVGRLSSKVDAAHLFVTKRAELLKRLTVLRSKLRTDAFVWISWPKKTSRVPSEVTEDVVRELALPLGWVDVKVCAVSEVWSGLKLVVRKELR